MILGGAGDTNCWEWIVDWVGGEEAVADWGVLGVIGLEAGCCGDGV